MEQMVRTIPSIMVVSIAVIYLLVFPAAARKYVIAFSLISAALAAGLLWLAFALPKSDVILAIVFMSYCLVAASFNLFLRTHGLGIAITLPQWLTVALIALGIISVLISLVMTGIVLRLTA
jgi:hypothetical protein